MVRDGTSASDVWIAPGICPLLSLDHDDEDEDHEVEIMMMMMMMIRRIMMMRTWSCNPIHQ